MCTKAKNLSNIQNNRSLGRLILLIVTICLIAPWLFTTMLIVCLLKRLVNRFFITPGEIFCIGLTFILKLQPWFQCKIIKPKKNEHKCAIYVSNHRSTLDVFLFLATIPNIRVVSKKMLFKIPILGQFMQIFKHTPIDVNDLRSIGKTIEKINQNLKKGYPVLIFPEMTRCKPGTKGTNKFTNLPFRISHQQKVPIIPVIISDTDLIWPRKNLSIATGHVCKFIKLAPIYPDHHATVTDLKKYVKDIIDNNLKEHLQ